MIISIIAAMAENRVIGRDGKLPWHLPADLRRFRELTTGHPVIMGRTTYESIGRPLPGRETIILSRQQEYRAPGCVVVHSLEAALAHCSDSDEAFICGGGEVYRQALPLANRIWLTVIHQPYDGDTFFPDIPERFQETAREELPGTPPFTLIRYDSISPGER